MATTVAFIAGLVPVGSSWPSPGVATRVTGSPAPSGVAGIWVGLTATPTRLVPGAGIGSAVVESGVSSSPAGRSVAARCPTRSARWSAGTLATDGSVPTWATARSSGANTCPAGIARAVTRTGAAWDREVTSQAVPAAPATIRAAPAASRTGLRRERTRGGRAALRAVRATCAAGAGVSRIVVIRSSGSWWGRRQVGW